MWLGNQLKDGIPLVKWSKLSRKNKLQGWGLNKIFLLKRCWLGKIFGDQSTMILYQIFERKIDGGLVQARNESYKIMLHCMEGFP